jgi:hypothetical protein
MLLTAQFDACSKYQTVAALFLAMLASHLHTSLSEGDNLLLSLHGKPHAVRCRRIYLTDPVGIENLHNSN